MKSHNKTTGKLKIELDPSTLNFLESTQEEKRTGTHAGWLSRTGQSHAGWLVKKSK